MTISPKPRPFDTAAVTKVKFLFGKKKFVIHQRFFEAIKLGRTLK
jgi:hypothetical protein